MIRPSLHFSIFLPLLALWLQVAPAQADVFKCTDSEGHITYSNVATKNCKALSLDPVPPPLPPTAKQKQESLKLKEESQQAEKGSVIECKGEKNCKKAFALTQIFITQHSDMKLQLVTDAVLETYNPTSSEELAIKATKTPGNGNVETVVLVAWCKNLGRHSSKSCLKREVEVYKQFRPYIEASLR